MWHVTSVSATHSLPSIVIQTGHVFIASSNPSHERWEIATAFSIDDKRAWPGHIKQHNNPPRKNHSPNRLCFGQKNNPFSFCVHPMDWLDAVCVCMSGAWWCRSACCVVFLLASVLVQFSIVFFRANRFFLFLATAAAAAAAAAAVADWVLLQYVYTWFLSWFGSACVFIPFGGSIQCLAKIWNTRSLHRLRLWLWGARAPVHPCMWQRARERANTDTPRR